MTRNQGKDDLRWDKTERWLRTLAPRLAVVSWFATRSGLLAQRRRTVVVTNCNLALVDQKGFHRGV